MKNTLQIKNNEMINASLLFFIINANQVGVGIHGFQRLIYQDAKNDAWISVLLSFLMSHIVVYIMIKTLQMYGSNDLYGIHQDVYGVFIGNFLNFLYIIYCSFGFFVILKNFTEVINTWVFPYVATPLLSVSLFLIVIYGFIGGFRVIVGICFFSVFFTFWIPPILLFNFKYLDFNYLLPIFNSDLIDLLKGAYSMSFTIVGFEIINFIYPNVKEKDKVNKFVHLGMLLTLFLYMFIMLISLTFFSGEQLLKTIWATLTLFSVIRLPFIERIEIVTISLWMIIILPNLCLYMWAAYRGVLRITNISPKKFVWIFSIILFILTLFVQSRTHIDALNTIFGKIAFIVVFVYPFVLFLFASLKKRFSKQQVGKN